MEKVDVLLPPDFRKSGIVKTREQAIIDGDWLGTFNLWVVKDRPEPTIVYQQRSGNVSLFPNKLDVTVGGHYQSGETIEDGLREVREEIGKNYRFADLFKLGQKIFIGPDRLGHIRHYIIDVFMIKGNSPLSSYNLEKAELQAIFECPISSLKALHENRIKSITLTGLNSSGDPITTNINVESFPFNWDNYHRKMVYLAERFLQGEKNLFY